MYLVYIMRLNSEQECAKCPFHSVQTRITPKKRQVSPLNSVTPSRDTIFHSPGSLVFLRVLMLAPENLVTNQITSILACFGVVKRRIVGGGKRDGRACDRNNVTSVT